MYAHTVRLLDGTRCVNTKLSETCRAESEDSTGIREQISESETRNQNQRPESRLRVDGIQRTERPNRRTDGAE